MARVAPSLLVAALLVVAVLAPAGVHAQRRIVSVEVHGVFGDDLVLPNSYHTIRVDVRNASNRMLRGEIELTARSFQGGPSKHRVRLDLPPRSTRFALVTVFVAENGTTIEVQYRVDGTTLARGAMSPGYSPAAESIVVLANPPRMRGPLIDIDVEMPGTPWTGPRMVRLPVGVVSFDPASGDPVLPGDGVAWATVRLLVAHAPELTRASATDQQALRDWIAAGGQMLIFPRSDADLRDPAIRALVGDDVQRVALAEGDSLAGSRSLVPEGARGFGLRGSRLRPEPFGGSARLGFGRVYVATFDGAVQPFVDAPETRALAQAILQTPRTHGVTRPILPYGGQDDVQVESFYGQGPSFTTLRSALDPNEGYRPALGLVAIVLLIYVLVVGPVNFTFVGRTHRPTVALMTTPAAAAACLVLLLGVGYLGKGTRTRYRRVEVVEVVEGDREGVGRRYAGLFLTRPSTFDLESPARGVIRTVRGAGGEAPPTADHSGERPVLRDVRGRLWETVFVREDRMTDLEGAIRFERAGRRLVAVRNQTPHTIRGAVVIDAVGSVYSVGDIAPGARAAISPVSRMTLQGPGTPMFYGVEDPNLRQFAEVIGLRQDEDRKVLDGVAKIFGGTLVTPPMPTLFARIEGDRARVSIFGAESDHRFIRVVPDDSQEVTP